MVTSLDRVHAVLGQYEGFSGSHAGRWKPVVKLMKVVLNRFYGSVACLTVSLTIPGQINRSMIQLKVRFTHMCPDNIHAEYDAALTFLTPIDLL